MWARFAAIVVLCFTSGTASGAAQVGVPECFGMPATIVGTNGDDTIIGTPGPDVIVTLGGYDAVAAGAGDDRVCTGDASDLVLGQEGNDMIDGGAGVDAIDGGPGDDTIVGGAPGSSDNDFAAFLTASRGVVGDLRTGVVTGEGRDTLTNIESLMGSKYDDRLVGDARSNVLTGLGGSNVLEGGDGADVLDGDFFQRAQADPRLVGTPGHNRVDGGSGNDTLFGGPDADVLLGGAGFADTVSYDNSESAVNVDLAAGRARGAGLDRINGVENIQGSPYADTLAGDGNPNELFGNGNNDTLVGRAGADFLGGGPGRDTAVGGRGSDYCLGDETASGCEIVGSPSVATPPEPPPAARIASSIDALLSLLTRRTAPSANNAPLRRTAKYQYSAEPICISTKSGGMTEIAPPNVVQPVGNDGAREQAWWQGTLFREVGKTSHHVQARTSWAQADLAGNSLLPGGIVTWRDLGGDHPFASPEVVSVPRGRYVWKGQIYWVRSGGRVFADVEPHIIRARTITHNKNCDFR